MVHYQAGKTCHITLAAISRPPSPHTEAGRQPLLQCHHCFRVHHTDNNPLVHHLHTWPCSSTPNMSSSPRITR